MFFFNLFLCSLHCFESINDSPWNEAPYKNAAEETKDGELSLEAFLSLVIKNKTSLFNGF